MGVPKNNNIYQVFAQYYDEMMRDNHIYDEYVQYIEDNFDKNAVILDVACGTGELIKRLVKKNFCNIEGSDNSKQMVGIARRKTNKNIYIMNLSKFDVGKEYDLITCSFDSLNYLLSEKSLFGFFKSSIKSLREDGHLLFDMNTKQKFVQNNGKMIYKIKDGSVIIDSSYDDEYWTLKISVNIGKKNHIETHKERAYPIKLVLQFLKQAGYRLAKYNYSNFSGSSDNKQRCFFVATK